jgi:CubicO group peptidase (beta-lactamase class C family)
VGRCAQTSVRYLAIGQLIDAGKLSLETKLNDCIAYRNSSYATQITIGQLLNHTSGIADYYDEEKITDFENFALSIPTYDLKRLEDYLPAFPEEAMKFAPGTRFSYCNGGYILLGLVVEAISGENYQDYVKQHILEPLGMDQSGFFWLNNLPENTASGYLNDAAGRRSNIYNLPIVGGSDGGMFTTARDLSVLWKSFFDGRILSQGLVELYSRPSVRVESAGEHISYGYGLWIADNVNREVYLLCGDAGVSFKSSINRAQDLQCTMISNTTGGVWDIRKAIEAELRAALNAEI